MEKELTSRPPVDDHPQVDRLIHGLTAGAVKPWIIRATSDSGRRLDSNQPPL